MNFLYSSVAGGHHADVAPAGVEESDGRNPSPNWMWVRLLKRAFSIDMERCTVCQQGRLRIIAAILEASVVKKILRHLKLAVGLPPIVPAR